jgi:hypothetical protein
MRTADADVEKYLKMFTLLPVEEISSVIQDHQVHSILSDDASSSFLADASRTSHRAETARRGGHVDGPWRLVPFPDSHSVADNILTGQGTG